MRTSRLKLMAGAIVVSVGLLGGLGGMSPAGAGRVAMSAMSGAGSWPSTCFWYGPYVAGNPGFNVAYPDTGAAYWSTNMKLPEGARLVLRGTYAHARYESFTVYRPDGTALDAVNDTEIVPDAGSRNPFLPDARRAGAADRDFTVEVVNEALPSGSPEVNTLHAGNGDGGRQFLVMRMYVPDRGRDITGGVGLPRPELRLADGSVIEGKAACRALDVERSILPVPLPTPEQYMALRDKPGAPVGFPAQEHPVFRAFFNPELRVRCVYSLNPSVDCYPASPPRRSGGLYPNVDNGYMYLYASRHFGEVLVLRGKMPTTPATYKRNPRMRQTQLRYWSMCQNESLATAEVRAVSTTSRRCSTPTATT